MYFPAFLLNSSLISLWLKNIFCMISSLLNVLRFVLCLRIMIYHMFMGTLKKVYSAVISGVFCKSRLNPVDDVEFLSMLSDFLSSCLSVIERKVLKSPSIRLDFSAALFFLHTFHSCFLVHSYLDGFLVSLYNIHLCLWFFFAMKCMLPDINIAPPALLWPVLSCCAISHPSLPACFCCYIWNELLIDNIYLSHVFLNLLCHSLYSNWCI